MQYAEQATPVQASFRPSFNAEPFHDIDAALDAARYCPTDLLGTFTLLMSGHGRCVSASMMLGDRDYAMLQLSRAHTMADDMLRAVAVRLFAYFDNSRAWPLQDA